MTFETFLSSVAELEDPPQSLPALLASLWHERKGDWERAHRIAQEVAGADAAWVHAYLHRREGDLGNAAYWYRRAGRPVCNDDMAIEWETIARALIEDS